MSRSFFAHPAVQRLLFNLGPLVLYSVLSGLSGWAAVASGWHSAGAFVGGWLAVVFGLIVVQEVRYVLTGVHVVHRQ